MLNLLALERFKKLQKHLAMALPSLNLQQQLVPFIFLFFFTPCLLYFVVAPNVVVIIPRLDVQK
jgi:hypothetical protein